MIGFISDIRLFLKDAHRLPLVEEMDLIPLKHKEPMCICMFEEHTGMNPPCHSPLQKP